MEGKKLNICIRKIQKRLETFNHSLRTGVMILETISMRFG